MGDAREALAKRIRELRRRHFGASGKGAFAERLGVSVEEVAKFEEGLVPAGDVLVRICELTGEDLQWLLTGEASRGSVVISGTRHRHRDLISRLAQALDEKPSLAAPVEAFVDLLLRGEDARRAAMRALPTPAADELIPLLRSDEAPEFWPDDPGGGAGRGGRRFALGPGAAVERRQELRLSEAGPARAALSSLPAVERDSVALVQVVAGAADGGAARDARRFIHGATLARDFPAAIAIEVGDDAMSPLLQRGDAALISPEFGPRVGEAAICRLRSRAAAICRVWLAESDDEIIVGRVGDGEQERFSKGDVCWSASVLFRLAIAA